MARWEFDLGRVRGQVYAYVCRAVQGFIPGVACSSCRGKQKLGEAPAALFSPGEISRLCFAPELPGEFLVEYLFARSRRYFRAQ